MKLSIILGLSTVIQLAAAATCLAALTTEQVDEILADPAKIADIIGKGSVEESAAALVQLIEAVEASSLSGEQKRQVIALLAARAAAAAGKDAAELFELVVKSVKSELVPLLVAAAALGSPEQAEAIKNAVIVGLGKDSAVASAVIQAAKDPFSILGEELAALITGQQSSGTGAGEFLSLSPAARYLGQ